MLSGDDMPVSWGSTLAPWGNVIAPPRRVMRSRVYTPSVPNVSIQSGLYTEILPRGGGGEFVV